MTPRKAVGEADKLAQWAAVLQKGGCLIYPTETLYALGVDGLSEEGVARLDRIKPRSREKPFPLLIGDRGQLDLVTDLVDSDLEQLITAFWPGPLSIVVSARQHLPSRVCDMARRVSVRWTPHPVAQQLCRMAGAPLVATSANLSGHLPSATQDGLDPRLKKQVDGVVTLGPAPMGGLPSTVVEPLGSSHVLVRREGAVSVDTLQKAGFAVIRA